MINDYVVIFNNFIVIKKILLIVILLTGGVLLINIFKDYNSSEEDTRIEEKTKILERFKEKIFKDYNSSEEDTRIEQKEIPKKNSPNRKITLNKSNIKLTESLVISGLSEREEEREKRCKGFDQERKEPIKVPDTIKDIIRRTLKSGILSTIGTLLNFYSIEIKDEKKIKDTFWGVEDLDRRRRNLIANYYSSKDTYTCTSDTDILEVYEKITGTKPIIFSTISFKETEDNRCEISITGESELNKITEESIRMFYTLVIGVKDLLISLIQSNLLDKKLIRKIVINFFFIKDGITEEIVYKDHKITIENKDYNLEFFENYKKSLISSFRDKR